MPSGSVGKGNSSCVHLVVLGWCQDRSVIVMRLAFGSLQGSYMLHRKLTVFSGQIQIFVLHSLSQWIQTESQMIREIDMNTKTMWITRLGVGVATAGLLISGANAVQAAPGGGLQQLVTSGVISEDERAAYRAAVESLKDEGMSCREAKPVALDQLVASGELTMAQAEEIAAVRNQRGRNGNLNQLVTSGVITEGEMTAFKSAVSEFRADGMSRREAKSAALDQLVASGELTAAQAGEISAAKRSGRGNRDGQDQGTTQNANPSSTGSAIYSI